ncbi:MAG: ATP synthase subunit I [Acidimicrobiia bacterium]
MIADLLIGLGAGILAGIVFFGGLRWTVERLPLVRRPGLLISASFLIRTVVLAGVLVLASQGDLVRVVAGLVGVIAARTAIVALARRGDREETTRWT